MSQLEQKLRELTSASRFDLCSPGECMQLLESGACITYNKNAWGCGRMLKVLLRSSCSFDCAYCGIRLNRRGLSFTPEELARTFLRLYREGRVGGLFLSSGIPHDVELVMGELIETARLIRAAGYDSYLHLKILPGAGRTDIAEAAKLANRISINVEATSASRLQALSGVKDYQSDILKRQEWIAEAKPGHHTTQLVIGAAGESDSEIFTCVTDMYRRVRPARVYYSGFHAIPKTRLSGLGNAPPWRIRRWYQVDYLIREYGMPDEALRTLFTSGGTLMNEDPKSALARDMDPIDPNTAGRGDLLRVPGIGPDRADAIPKSRKSCPIRTLADIRSFGIPVRRVAPYLALPGESGRQATLEGFGSPSPASCAPVR
jgi:predicted DNA-binding helix-hairpin-helix protein